METLPTLEWPLPTQDGGNCSSTMVAISTMRRTESVWMSQEQRTMRTRISKCGRSIKDWTSNGISSMSKTCLKRPRKERWILTSASRLILHSTLCPRWPKEGTLTCLEETWSSRDQMEEKLRFGTSTKNPRPWRTSPTTNPLISKAQERKTTCKSGAPTADGGNSSNLMESTSRTSRTTSASMLQEEKMLKDKMFKYGRDTMVLTRDGQFSIRMTKRRKLKDWTRTLVSRSMNHSLLFQECPWRE